jgi:hypothetical protein
LSDDCPAFSIAVVRITKIITRLAFIQALDIFVTTTTKLSLGLGTNKEASKGYTTTSRPYIATF